MLNNLGKVIRLMKYSNNEYRILYVWKELKRSFTNQKLDHGVYEDRKEIEARFNMNENEIKSFWYWLSKQENELYATTDILNIYPEESTTEIFILTSHLNSVLKRSKIIIDPEKSKVTLLSKISFFDCLYDSQLIQYLVCSHFEYAKDINWAFKKLILEKEEPVFIIDELIKSKEKSNPDNLNKN